MSAAKKPRREPLTRERVLATALALIDGEGLDALSMRRVGEELGVEAMSLYNHVPNKAALLDGVFEQVLSELPSASPSRSPKLALRRRALELRAVLRAHPRALPLFVTRSAVTRASLAHVESVLETMHALGFSAERALSSLNVLVAYVVGHSAASYAVEPPDERSVDYAPLDPETFPRMSEAARHLPTHDVEREFEFGLDALLTGIAGGR